MQAISDPAFSLSFWYVIIANGTSRAPSPTNTAIPHLVSTFKRFCHKENGTPIFQRSYYDHVIRNQQDYDEIWQYIENNPTKWAMKKQGSEQKSAISVGLTDLIRWPPPAAECCFPVAVPGVRLADGAAALHTDRGHSFGSLLPPPAALPSLPRFELATSSLPTILEAVLPCASYRKLSDKTLVCQRLFGFGYRCLL